MYNTHDICLSTVQQIQISYFRHFTFLNDYKLKATEIIHSIKK